MHVLFLSKWFPYPTNNGSKLRIYHLLKGLAQQHQVTLLSFADQPVSTADKAHLETFCTAVQTVPAKAFRPHSLRAQLGFLSTKPRSAIDTFSAQMANSIQTAVAADQYDLVIASQTAMASYAPYCKGVPCLFEELELATYYDGYRRSQTVRQRLRTGLTWAKHRRYIAHLLHQFAVCTVVSEPERELLKRCAPTYRAAAVIPNCIDLESYGDVRAIPRPNSLVFAGSFTYAPNYEAMLWFLREVFPLVRRQIPAVHLTITGNHADLPIPLDDQVSLVGYVDDVRPVVAASTVSLAPIFTGGGTRLKILEAMALGVPVVATTKGAEGLETIHGEHLLLADTPQAYADAVLHLLRDAALRQRITANAYTLIQEKYDWNAVMPAFLDIVDRLGSPQTPGRLEMARGTG